MIIKRLSASFGRLKGETLTLREGLNIIEACNESGKSTWCAFIKAMLYGIRTSDRDKQGYLSDKTRYRPWSGAPMEGSMDIEAAGLILTLERKSDGKLPLRDFSAVHTGTASPYVGLHPETAGETLLGVSEAVFERSAYMSQAGLRISQTPELEKRISALVTTGDETSSYTEADERLRLWLRKRRYNKSGVIPALEEKLAAINKKLAQIEYALDEAASMRLEAERLKKRQTELSDELAAIDKFDAQQSMRQAKEKLERAQASYNIIYSELTKNGPAPTESDISVVRGDLKALESFNTLLEAEQKRLKDAQNSRDKIAGAGKAGLPGGPDTKADVQKAASLEQDIKRTSFKNASAAVLLLLTVVTALVAVFAGALAPQLPILTPVAAAIAVVCAIILVWRGIRLAGMKRKLDELLDNYNVASAAALQDMYEEGLKLSSDLAEAESDVKAIEKSVASAKQMADTVIESLRAKLSSLSLDTEIGSAEASLIHAELLLQKLSGAKAELAAAESYLNTLKASSAANGGEAAAPLPTRHDIASDLNQITARLEDLSNRYNMALGEIRAVGDPVILGSEKKSAEASLAAQKLQYDALALAIETMKNAHDDLQTRFSPLLSETAGQIIGRLTGGRYEKLTFDKALDANAKTAGETVSRNILALSAGTADQIYLALRLAVSELVLPKECPLILDDALTNFDDERASLALDYLKELARERQILLFTCHKREAAHFAGSTDVTVVRLN